MSDYSESDPFWVKNRAEFLAAKSTSADPSACGTCRGNAEAGEPVEHDECQQRATLLQAPDHPYYEILAGFSLEENEKLPARFHIPVFDDSGVPNSWLCAVCQEEGTVVGWPCATAVKYGTKVFTPLHAAETAQKKQAARIAELETELSEYEQLSPQQCPKGVHADWLVDSEYAHACPWCQIDGLRSVVAAHIWDGMTTHDNSLLAAVSLLQVALAKAGIDLKSEIDRLADAEIDGCETDEEATS